MSELWAILLVLLGLAAVVAGVMLATGNKPWAASEVDPLYPPADPGAEGMNVTGPGEVSPGAAEDEGGGRG